MGSYQHKDVRPNDSTVDGNKVGTFKFSYAPIISGRLIRCLLRNTCRKQRSAEAIERLIL
jgi:hypothetical protein